VTGYPLPKFYLGDPAQLERQFSRDVAATKREDPFSNVVVVVESNLAGIYLRRALAKLIGSHSAVRFVVLKDLAAELARQFKPDLLKDLLPPFGEQWVSIMTARQAAGGYFSLAAKSCGFNTALRETFSELLEAQIEQLQTPAGSDPLRIQELQQLYDQYRSGISNFINSTGLYQLAVKAVPPSDPFRLLIYGGYSYTAAAWQLVQALVCCKSLAATVYWQSQAEYFAPLGKLKEKYLDCGLSLCYLDSGTQRNSSNLALLQKNLFASQSDPSAPVKETDSSLQFVCAADELQEVQFITQEIIRLARSGHRFTDLAVLVHDPIYIPLIREQFFTAGIPLCIVGGSALAQTKTARGLLLFLALIGSDYTRSQVMELITYAPFDYAQILASPERVVPAYWDLLIREAGVVAHKEQWFVLVEQLCRRHQGLDCRETIHNPTGSPDFFTALNQLQLFLSILFEAVEQFPVRGSWDRFIRACRELMEKFFYSGEELEAVFEQLELLRTLDRFGDQLELSEAILMLKQAFEAGFIPEGRFQKDGVNLIPAKLISGIRFDVIFIPGLVDKVVPPQFPGDPLLSESERRFFHGVLTSKKQKLIFKALEFSIIVNSACEKAIFTWPRAGAADSRERFPSSYLFKIGEALLGIRLLYSELNRLPGYTRLKASPFPPGCNPAGSVLAFDLNICAHQLPGLTGEQYLAALSPWAARLLIADRAYTEKLLTPHQGVFAPGGLAALRARELLTARHLAVTALEMYARCPYLFFLNYLLRLDFEAEPGAGAALSPRQRGQLLHRILHKFYHRAAKHKLPPPARHPGRWRELLEEVCRESFKNAEGEFAITGLFWKMEQRLLTESLTAFLDWEIRDEGNFKVIWLEISFGGGAAKCPVELPLPGGELLKLKGRLDRVDRCGERVRVIDYKTGNVRMDDEDLEGGTALQLPLYLMAAQNLLGLPNLEEAEALACYLSPGEVKSALYSGRNWPEKEQQLQNVLQQLYSGMVQGRYFPYPGKQGESCRSCRFRSLCGPGVDRLFSRKSDDPIIKDFLMLKDRDNADESKSE